jgi:hypothetical protein
VLDCLRGRSRKGSESRLSTVWQRQTNDHFLPLFDGHELLPEAVRRQLSQEPIVTGGNVLELKGLPQDGLGSGFLLQRGVVLFERCLVLAETDKLISLQTERGTVAGGAYRTLSMSGLGLTPREDDQTEEPDQRGSAFRFHAAPHELISHQLDTATGSVPTILDKPIFTAALL